MPGGTASKEQYRETQYQIAKTIFVSQENVKMAINEALTAAVPTTFCQSGFSVVPLVYTATNIPETTLLDLQQRYGKTTLAEKTEADVK